ncbi:EcsC family protein [Gluconacetobacter sp. 1b LMG 1731]|uniref:EcsC family protein n=1 Tax=Gluconacetobacter dulcium TaxID=2729096 RepID=A0A7W4NS60_9PROT|nr:EcsC family protein [Gluconacetobacter dulcium]MBB2164172.1 EcsC family protein [Gluconacetobacter dulcium]MBB2193420.1 EcsC family protein [Gluconacetobacter dulcium]
MTIQTGGEIAPMVLDAPAIAELQRALEKVESGRGVLVRLADLMGGAVGQAAMLGMRGLGMAPTMQAKLKGIAETAISRAFDVAIVGMTPLKGEQVVSDSSSPASAALSSSAPVASAPLATPAWRGPALQAAVTVSGAVGGFAGLAGLLPDITFTTMAIMREIARIAREEGEDLSSQDARRACLEVFALRAFPVGASDDESELGYFSARAMLRGRPVVMLVSEVASHYGLGLSRKLAVQMMPVAGALCGASLNVAFLAHYRALARAHFTIRRLEREHGPEVRRTAESLRATMTGASQPF